MSAIERERTEHPVLLSLALAWVFVAAGICLPALGTADVDARALVAGASTLGLATGVGGAWLLHRERLGWAAVALVVSAIVTPTYFAYVVNLEPLGVAVGCLKRR